MWYGVRVGWSYFLPEGGRVRGCVRILGIGIGVLVRCRVRGRFRDDRGIRWWEREDFTVQTCWRGGGVQGVQWYLLTIFKSSKWSEPRASAAPERG